MHVCVCVCVRACVHVLYIICVLHACTCITSACIVDDPVKLPHGARVIFYLEDMISCIVLLFDDVLIFSLSIIMVRVSTRVCV